MIKRILVFTLSVVIIFSLFDCTREEQKQSIDDNTKHKIETTNTEKVLSKLSVTEIESFPLLRGDWTEKQMQDAGLRRTVDPSGQINYFDGNVEYSYLDMAETPICTEIFGKCDVETPRDLYVGESFDDVMASFPQDKDWKTDPNGVFYGNYYETDEHEPTGSVSYIEGYPKHITLTTENVTPFMQIYFDMNDNLEKFRIYFVTD